MPLRRIKIPAAVTFKNHKGEPRLVQTATGEVVPEAMAFGDLLNRLMENPKWGESYVHALAQRSILDAFHKAENDQMVVSEEDWKLLKETVEKPMTPVQLPDGTVRVAPGFGIFPSLVSQLVPMLSCIVDASQEG
jgi:hypothetical protein